MNAFLRDQLDALMDDPSLFVVELKVKGSQREPKFHVFLDGDQGITIGQCAKLSKRLYKAIEEQLGEQNFSLDVSSAGADEEIKLPRQYEKLTGKQLLVETMEGAKHQGQLLGRTDTAIELEMKEKKKTWTEAIAYQDIKSAKVVLPF